MGLSSHVSNVVMQTGDEFLTNGNAEIALEFYLEAKSLFPHASICCIREAQCHLALVSIDLGPVVRKVDSAIQRIVIFSNFLKLFIYWFKPV